MGPKPNDWCPYKRRGHTETQRRGHVRMEIGKKWLQAKEFQGLPGSTRRWKRKEVSSLEPSKRT